MTEPFVPSGREYDEGDIPASKKVQSGRLRRGLRKLTGRGRGASRIRRHQLQMDDAVGERLPGSRPSVSPEQSGTDAPQGRDTPRDSVEPDSSATSRRVQKKEHESVSDERSAVSQRIAQPWQRFESLGLTIEAFQVLLIAEGDCTNSECRHALEGCTSDLGNSSIGGTTTRWLLDVTEPGNPAPVADVLATALAPDAVAVLKHIAKGRQRDRLGAYKRSRSTASEWEKAMRDLDAAAKRYPSLKGFAADLREGRLHPNWVQNIGGNDSPALKHCREEINAGRRAHENRLADTSYGKTPGWPSVWGGPANGHDQDLVSALVTRLSDNPIAARAVRTARRSLSDDAQRRVAQVEFLEGYGVRASEWTPETSVSKRRRAKRA